MTDQIPFDLLLFIAMHGLPCLLQCDGAGHVHRRI